MSSKDFIPGPNGAFNDWQHNFVTIVNANMASWDLPTAAAAEWTLLTSTANKKMKRWDAAWAIIAHSGSRRDPVMQKIIERKDAEWPDSPEPWD